MDALLAAETGAGHLPHCGILVHGVDHLDIGRFIHDAANGPEHLPHGLAQVFAAVRREQNEPAAAGPFDFRMGVIASDGGVQRIDHRVAGYEDMLGGLALLEEVLPAQLRGRKVKPGDEIHRLAVELLREGGIQVVGPQPCFHVSHGNLKIEARQRRDKRSGGIAMHQHDIGLFRLQNGAQLFQNAHCDIKERLLVAHDGQVVLGRYLKAL